MTSIILANVSPITFNYRQGSYFPMKCTDRFPLNGACHRAYGSMPNMTWIFGRSGVPIYKSDWTDTHSVENAISYFLEVLEWRRQRERLIPFRAERLDYRTSDTEAFYKGLERNGPKAVREFMAAGV